MLSGLSRWFCFRREISSEVEKRIVFVGFPEGDLRRDEAHRRPVPDNSVTVLMQSEFSARPPKEQPHITQRQPYVFLPY